MEWAEWISKRLKPIGKKKRAILARFLLCFKNLQVLKSFIRHVYYKAFLYLEALLYLQLYISRAFGDLCIMSLYNTDIRVVQTSFV